MPCYLDNYYYGSGQEDYSAYSYEDSTPYYESYGPYYDGEQEVEPFFREATPRNMIPYFEDNGVGLGIMYPDNSQYYYDTASTPGTSQSNILPPALSLAKPDRTVAIRPNWVGRYSYFGDYTAFYGSPESEETVVEGPRSLTPPPIDLHFLDEEDSMTSLFQVDEGWEEKLINSYTTTYEVEDEDKKECTFEPQVSFFYKVTDSVRASLSPTPEPAYKYQDPDSTPKANSKPKAFSASSFRDDYLSLYCYNGQRKSVTSGTVTLVNPPEVAQVAEISHISESTPRNSGGSFTRRRLKKAVSPKTYRKLFKRAGRKLGSRSKQRLESW